jgi:hypothetical protein
MDQIILATGEAPEIVITSVGGDLRLQGWEQNQFQAESDDDHSLTAEQKNGSLALVAGADCTVRVPRRATVRILQVGGDARVKSVEAPVEIQNVGGDLVLRRTAGVTLGHVGGDVSAKKIDGPFSLRAAGGDVSARNVAGEFSADRVGADLYLRDVNAGARARVGAVARLNLDFAPDHEYDFEVGGDIYCRLPPGVSAKITLEADGDISMDVPGAQVEGGGNSRVVTLGNGEAHVRLEAGGDISLSPLTADPDAMGDFGEHFGEEFGVMAEEFAAQIGSQIESQFESQMADFEKQLAERMANLNAHVGPGRVNAEEIAARARRATEKARRKVEIAQRRMERQAEAAQRRAAEHAKSHKKWRGFGFTIDAPLSPAAPRPPVAPRPPTLPVPPVEPISNDEHMTILRMLEQRKITVDQAEKLLAALEGNA